MPVSYKILAQGELGTTSSNFYTVPSNTQTVISSVTFHNRTSSEVEVSLNTVTELGIFGSWTTSQSPFSSIVTAMVYGGGQYVAGTSGGEIATSTNGITWQTRTSSFVTSINAIAYGNGVFVAVGEVGNVATSTDGITWTTRNGLFGTSDINDIAYGNGIFLAGGSGGALRTSTNGVTWTTRIGTSANTVGSINYAGGRFFAAHTLVNAFGSIAVRTSTDAISWATTSLNVSSVLILSLPKTPVTFFNNEYISAFRSRIWSSTDGITWTTRSSTDTPGYLDYLQISNNYLLGTSSSDPLIYVSSDTTTWVTRSIGVNPYSIAVDEKVVLGGFDGRIKQGNYDSGADFPNVWDSVMERTLIEPNSSVTLNLGLTLSAANKLFARCNTPNAVTISAFGREES